MTAYGTFETSADVRYTAAFGGKADIRRFMSTRPQPSRVLGQARGPAIPTAEHATRVGCPLFFHLTHHLRTGRAAAADK